MVELLKRKEELEERQKWLYDLEVRVLDFEKNSKKKMEEILCGFDDLLLAVAFASNKNIEQVEAVKKEISDEEKNTTMGGQGL